MSREPKQTRRAVARVATLTRHHGAEHPDTIAARRDLAAANIEAAIARAVAEAPPLSVEQRARIAGILLGEAAGGES